MKRPRPSTGMFGDSSSESDTPPPRSKPFPHNEPFASPKPAKDEEHEDTLEAFMTGLSKQQGQPSNPPPTNYSDSSEDEQTPFKQSNIAEQQVSPHAEKSHARDLSLPRTDFTKVKLPQIVRDHYKPPPEVLNQTGVERTLTLTSFGATVKNGDEIYPLQTFQSLAAHIPESLLSEITSSYSTPTPIQSIAIPSLLSYRDVIGIAKTGSGKTLAYSIPLLSHISRQSGTSTSGRGPCGLVLSPTRELALQITSVIRKLGSSVCPVIGGCGKYEQYKKLRDGGAEVVVATPGRLIDMLKMRACGMNRCSFIVFDEADRMLDMGFGPQVEAILGVIRDDAQQVMFSATFPKVVERLAKGLLKRAVRIEISDSDARGAMVNDGVKEVYVNSINTEGRMKWLEAHLTRLLDEGLVILFCATRGDAAEVANQVRLLGFPAACVHGETDAADRQAFVKMFKTGEIRLLVTTDVSARGLDIADVNNVINYGCAKSWEWHVHRVGRTGRAGRRGTAYTLVTRARQDSVFVMEALEMYKRAGVEIPEGLQRIVQEVDVALPKQGWRGKWRPRGRGRWR